MVLIASGLFKGTDIFSANNNQKENSADVQNVQGDLFYLKIEHRLIGYKALKPITCFNRPYAGRGSGVN